MSRSWHGTTLLGSMRGVQVDMAVWRAAPKRKCIWEYLLHAAYWKFSARRAISGDPANTFERKPRGWPRVPKEPTLRDLKRDVEYVTHEHGLWRDAVEALTPARLKEETGNRESPLLVDYVLGVTAHDLYHAGQIQLVKRLYRGA